jgi:ectoine hydroxylase-related dioxygenase (phytanoyl-CoA dioxygenase family)
MNEALIVSRPDEDAAALRERFQEVGYLYFKNYIAGEKCDALLQAFLQELSPHIGFDEQGGNPILAGEPFFETDAVWDDVYPRMQKLESFHRFFHEADVQALMHTLLDDQVFVYPMKMARIATPRKKGYETPPHQDAHSHQAGPTMAGIWVALHDMSEEMGRLQLLPGSHKKGVRPVHEAQGVGGVQCEIYPDETTWHVSDYGKGDVILFHSCCVHKSEPNTAEKAARMSVDTRFCDYGAPVFVTNFDPHHGWRIDTLDWDAIYSGWQDDWLQYYWQDYPNKVDTLLSERAN